MTSGIEVVVSNEYWLLEIQNTIVDDRLSKLNDQSKWCKNLKIALYIKATGRFERDVPFLGTSSVCIY